MPSETFTLETRNSWDLDFFSDFCELRNRLYEAEKLFIRQSVEDLRRELESPYFLKNGVKYRAFLWRSEGTPVARVICYHDPQVEDVVSFGHFECEQNAELSEEICRSIERFCRECRVSHYRGPMQGNFFFSYRAKIQGDPRERFYSEPHHDPRYFDIFSSWGMEIKKRWYSTSLDIRKSSKNYKKIRSQTHKKHQSYSDLKVRFIFPWRWKKSLRTIHQLFLESYKDMSDFTPLDFETFEMMYDDFRYLINPFFSYIVEYRGEPVGFSINFFDPLELICNSQKRGEERLLSKLWLLLRLKLNRQRLLVMYVGKKATSWGEEVKGVQPLVSKYIFFMCFLFRVKEMIICYTASDSPANRGFKDEHRKKIAEYAIFSKTLK